MREAGDGGSLLGQRGRKSLLGPNRWRGGRQRGGQRTRPGKALLLEFVLTGARCSIQAGNEHIRGGKGLIDILAYTSFFFCSSLPQKIVCLPCCAFSFSYIPDTRYHTKQVPGMYGTHSSTHWITNKITPSSAQSSAAALAVAVSLKYILHAGSGLCFPGACNLQVAWIHRTCRTTFHSIPFFLESERSGRHRPRCGALSTRDAYFPGSGNYPKLIGLQAIICFRGNSIRRPLSPGK